MYERKNGVLFSYNKNDSYTQLLFLDVLNNKASHKAFKNGLEDVKNNKKTIYQHSPISAQKTGFHGLHYANGKFYIFLVNTTGGYLNIVDEEDFFGPVISQTKFYKNNSYWFRQVLVYLGSVALLLGIFYYSRKRVKKMNKVQLMDNGLKYRNKFREFKPDSMQILKLLHQ